MKTHSHWLLTTIRALFTIAWYLNIVLIILAFGMLTWKFCTTEYTEFSNPVKYTPKEHIVKLTSLGANAKDIVLDVDQATLKMMFKNTPLNIFMAYFFLIGLEVLATTIIYQCRKFFDTIKHNEPFRYDNVKRLKLIALCFALLVPLHMLLGISKSMILHGYVKDFNLYNMVWEESFTGLILGAVIYIMADVFNRGFNLQKENEEFV